MIYPQDFENKVGFDSIRCKVIKHCESALGKEYAANLSFSTDFNNIRHNLLCVEEMTSVIREGLSLLNGSIPDLMSALNDLRVVGSYLTAERLFSLLSLLETMNGVGAFFRNEVDDDENPRFPELYNDFREIELFPLLISEIGKTVTKYGEIKDNASPELYEIRRSLRSASASIQSAMKRVMDAAYAAGIIEKDTAASLRDGRMVIPVPAGKKRSISGIVHDESATGKTVFIEPVEVVEAGNRLRELQIEEKREEVKILIRVSDVIREQLDALIASYRLIGNLDFIRGKAKFALEVDGQMPALHEKPEIEWYHAIHPGLLLSLRKQNREAVPLNITLGKDTRILIISGPNAGGKSVCLKTVAIVQYMMQCGLLPTLYSNSHMGIFKKIFIDIGDEQSFESDLSTYSSHLKNMKYFLQNSDSKTILLADEMGSGTEPQIGGALAQAILEVLGKSGCYGIVTTHYQNLKTFAETESGFVNGAMLYDRQHLQPTFELSIGTAGSSFALDIAQKIGLPKNVIDIARDVAGSDYVNLDKYLSEITRDRRYWANKRLSIKEKEKKLDSILHNYEETSSELMSQRKKIISEAKQEAKNILEGANSRIERTIRDIRNAEAEKERTKQIRASLKEYESSLGKEEDNLPDVLKPLKHKSKSAPKVKQEKKPENEGFKVGDYVKMKDGGVTGEILSINGKKAEVAFGQLRTNVSMDKLVKGSKPKVTLATQVSSVSRETDNASRERQLKFRNEIDVRGMRTDEALQAVTYFIDDAVQFNAGRVRILHGTGAGILKTMIRQYLSSNSAVVSMRDEDVRFGGAGITVVELI